MNPAEALRAAISSNKPGDYLFPKPVGEGLGQFAYSTWRFLKAWSDSGTFGPDHVVLLRQVARWKRGDVFVGAPANSLGLQRFGVVGVDSLGFLQADPFNPSWLLHDSVDSSAGIDVAPVPRHCSSGSLTEPFVRRLGFESWKSAAQKEAVWQSLMTPPGGTSLIVLPTGMGKSLCFQSVAALSSGLTVVIVPTIALAIDQSHNAQLLFDKAGLTDIRPRYYAADDSTLDPQQTVHEVQSGACRLIFTSPESCVSGKLRPVLEEAAVQQRLSNLVLDEAHLVETWGAYFRIEFQLLAEMRSKWLDASEGRLRTLLYSATVTPRCRQMLRALYAGESPWTEFVYQQLRPEINYFDRLFNGDEQDHAVLDCLWHLPRPLILYTTERDDAKRWYATCEQQGFKRIGCFHGETAPAERRRLLREWQDDRLDVMVATSAFGVGVDKPDVRSVVHACFPEDLNRYYQEVGRGGRDGNSSIAILLPNEEDIETSRSLAPKLMRPDRLQQRWQALWESRNEHVGDDGLATIHLQSKRRGLLGTRTYAENVRWNKRLLMQMRRARLLEVRDLELRYATEGEDPEEWAVVELRFNPESPRVGDLVSDVRQEELHESKNGHDLLMGLLRAERCVGRVLKTLFGDDTRTTCCGCRWCRLHGRRSRSVPEPEWDASVGEARVHLVFGGPVVFRQGKTEFLRFIRQCVDERGILRFVGDEDTTALFHERSKMIHPYRLVPMRFDSLDREPPFLVRSDEQIVVFHGRAVHSRGIGIRAGALVTHVFSQGISMSDVRFRLPSGVNPSRVFDSTEQWLSSKA